MMYGACVVGRRSQCEDLPGWKASLAEGAYRKATENLTHWRMGLDIKAAEKTKGVEKEVIIRHLGVLQPDLHGRASLFNDQQK